MCIYIWRGFPCSHLESTQLCWRFNLGLDVSSSNFPEGFFLSGDFNRIFSKLCNFSTAALGPYPILAAALGPYPILAAVLGPHCSLRLWICHLGSHSRKSLWKIPNTHQWWVIHLKSSNTKKIPRRTINRRFFLRVLIAKKAFYVPIICKLVSPHHKSFFLDFLCTM